MSESTGKQKVIMLVLVSLAGMIMILGLFFWYKSFAYYTYSIYTYQLDEITEDPVTEQRMMIKSLSRLKRYFETAIVNQSSSDITIEIYEKSNQLFLENIIIGPDEEFKFDSYEYEYKIVIYGEDITEDNIIVEAGTIQFLKIYRQSVIITMIIGIVMVAIWDILILFAFRFVETYGEKVNTGITVFAALGSVLSSILFYKGYFESNLCFIALFCGVLAFILKKRDHKQSYENIAMSTDEIYLTAGVISLFISCLMMGVMYNSTASSPFYIFNAANRMSLPDYVITAIVFFLLFLVLSGIFLKKQKIVSFAKYYFTGKEFFICVFAVAAAFIVQQPELAMAGNPGYSILCIGISAVLLYIFKHYKAENRPIKILPVYIIYILLVVLTAASTMVINYFTYGDDTINEVFHMSWYNKSMYYVVNHIPYPDKEFGLYGHYQQFYSIPMKLFGSNLLTVGIITGIAGGLTAFFIAGIIQMLTKSNFLRITGTVAAINILCSGLYIPIVPHRLLFPMMMLFFITCCRNKEMKWFRIIIGSVIAILSVIWNTEIGVVVILTWIAYLILKKSAGKDQCLGYVIKTTLLTLAALGAATAIIFVLILQISKMSDISQTAVLSDAFSILLDPDFMYTNQFNFIRWTNAPWIYIMMLFLGMAAYGISRMGFLGKDRDKNQDMPVIISVAVMGLGLMVYFISRPEDYSIVMFPVIFLVIFILDEMKQNSLQALISILCLFGFGCIILQTGETAVNLYSRIIEHHQLDYGLLKDNLDTFANEVPEGSFAYGNGLTEIYMSLGREVPVENNTEYWILDSKWDGENYITGWRSSAYDETDEQLTNIFRENEDFILVREVLFGDMHYYLYRNNGYN